GLHHHPRSAGESGEPPRHLFPANVVGDVTLEFGGRQPAISILLGHRVSCEVGDQHQTALACALDDLEWRKNCRSGHGLREADWIMRCDWSADDSHFPRTGLPRNAVPWTLFL